MNHPRMQTSTPTGNPFQALHNSPNDAAKLNPPGAHGYLAAPSITGTGRPGKLPQEFLDKEQQRQLGALVTAQLKLGANSTELEEAVRDWLRELPPGLLERAGWQVDALAEILALAGLVAGVAHRKRGLD